MSYLFTSESVSEGHPDKVADQISDAIIDHFLAFDADSKVACETLVTSGQVVLAGEVKSNAYLYLQKIVRDVIDKIGYNKSEYQFDARSCGILSAIHEQSSDISQGVERESPDEQGAGDQGMMFGYATNETKNYMPVSLDVSHKILQILAAIRKEGKKMPYLRPDSKSQVTISYDNDGRPEQIKTIVISTQHDEFVKPDDDSAAGKKKAQNDMQQKITTDIKNILMPRVIAEFGPDVQSLFSNDIEYIINPTGAFIIGGPHGDAGLTGRKIIVDTYGGKGAHGGGAFSGKDPSKVDRSAAYAMRHLAKNLVAAGVSEEILVQVSYAIGVAEPCGLYVNTYGKSKLPISDGQIANKLLRHFDLRPYAIEKRLKLRQPMYLETAAYGHMGREAGQKVKKHFFVGSGDEMESREVELFTWEKLDLVDEMQSLFGL